VPFKIHYRNNLNDKKDSYLIPRPPSWNDRNYSYGHQLYPSGTCHHACFKLSNKYVYIMGSFHLHTQSFLLTVTPKSADNYTSVYTGVRTFVATALVAVIVFATLR